MQYSETPAPAGSEGRITLPWLIARHMDRIFRGLEAPFMVNGIDGEEWRHTLAYLVFGLWQACKAIMDKGAKEGEKEDEVSLWAKMKKKEIKSPKDVELVDWLEEMGRIMGHPKIMELMTDKDLPTESIDDQLVTLAKRWGVPLNMPETNGKKSKTKDEENPGKEDLIGVI